MEIVFKKIEAYGFKSFADKMEVDFSGGVTCIVGPNGCGKSNFSDAVRWVLGEQSSKALRGTQMQDVIFKGTEKRKQLGFAEVSLHFDNSTKTFPIDYSEVVLSRKLYRSGESEYFINRQPSRLKDITNLLHDSGIDRDGLTIISQGQVTEIVNARPESRRDIFDEAAGIAKFKARKVEAERRLERTKIDLRRVTDVVAEIERGLGPLLKQAETAEKYIVLRDRLKLLEINSYIVQYDGAAETKAKLQHELDEITASLAAKQGELQRATESGAAALDELAALDKRGEFAREQVLQLSLGLERHSGERKLVQEKLTILGAQDADVKTEIAVLSKQLESERARSIENKKVLADSKANYAELTALLGRTESEYQSKAESERLLSNLRIARAESQARKRTIENLIESGEGFKFTVRKIIENRTKNNEIASNIIGVVAQLLVVPQELEAAIEVGLGAAAQNIITYDEDGAKRMVDLLRERNWGRATFLPVTSVRERSFSNEERTSLRDKCVIGIASELVDFDDSSIEPVVTALLGRVVVVDNIENAINLAKRTKYAFKIVTLDGDVIETRGSITGGSKNALNNNLWHTNSLAAINDELKKLDEQIAGLESGADVNAFREKLTNMKIKAAGLSSEIASIESNLSASANAILLLEKSISDKRAVKKALDKNIEMARGLEASENEEKLYYEAVRRLEMAKAEIDEFDTKKQSIRGRITELERLRSELADQIGALTQNYYKTESARAKVDIDIEQMQTRVSEEYGMNYSECYAFLQNLRQSTESNSLCAENFALDAAFAEITDLKRAISRLGPVNLNAIEDSKESKSRYDDYSTQSADLTAACADLEKVIRDLSVEMEARFREDFQKINHNFAVVFRELFNGGNAKLVLTDPNDILASGIDIIAEPPGKKLQNITLMSGGEKALTAIAILFAIIKMRPMPFCLLDEIEAALDEANAHRFASYLQKFSATTQFIVITHRKPTMELADNLYGVTMEEKGVSKLVSVKLESWQPA